MNTAVFPNLSSANHTANKLSTASSSYALGLFLISNSIMGTTGSFLCVRRLLHRPLHRCHTSSSSLITVFCPRNYSAMDLLLANLALTSLVFSALVAPIHAYTSIAGLPNRLSDPGNTFCQMTAFVYLVVVTASPLSHVAIAVNRLFVIVLNLSPKRSGVAMLIGTTWIISVLLAVWPLFSLGGRYGFKPHVNRCVIAQVTSRAYHVFIRTAPPLFCAPALLLCYTAVLVKIITAKQSLAHSKPVTYTRQSLRKRASSRVDIQCPGITVSITDSDGNTTERMTVSLSAGSDGSRSRRWFKSLWLMQSKEGRATKVALMTFLAFCIFYLPISIHGVGVALQRVTSPAGRLAVDGTVDTEETASPLHSGLAASLTVMSWAGFSLSPWITLCVDSHGFGRKH